MHYLSKRPSKKKFTKALTNWPLAVQLIQPTEKSVLKFDKCHVYLCSGTEDWNFVKRLTDDLPVIYCDYFSGPTDDPINANHVINHVRAAGFSVTHPTELAGADIPPMSLTPQQLTELDGPGDNEYYEERVGQFAAPAAWGLKAKLTIGNRSFTFYYLCVEALSLLRWLADSRVNVSGLCLVNQGDGLGGNWAGDSWARRLSYALSRYRISPEFIVAQPSWLRARHHPFLDFTQTGVECPNWLIDGRLPWGVGLNTGRVRVYRRRGIRRISFQAAG